jgi:hypothetical protein
MPDSQAGSFHDNKDIQESRTHRTKEKGIKKNKLRGLSPRANYTGRATAACR